MSRIDRDRPSPAELMARIGALEKKLAKAETDASWDALEPELLALRADVFDELEDDKADLAAARSAFEKAHGFWSRHNPFDSRARSDRQTLVGAKESELEGDRAAEHRIHQLSTRFYEDKTRKHAREFIRVAEKIQKGVTGSWESKANASSAAWLSGRSGEETIAYAKALREAVPGGRADHEDVALAASLSLLTPAAAAERLEELDTALGTSGEKPALVLAAALLSGRSASSAAEVLAALQGAPLSSNDRPLVEAAALLSTESGAASAALATALLGGSGIGALWDGPARVIAAALLAPKPSGPSGSREPSAPSAPSGHPSSGAGEITTFVDEVTKGLLGSEHSAPIAAAGLLSGRTAKDTAGVGKKVIEAVNGTPEAKSAIAAAAVLSGRPADEAIAFAKHVQSELTGSWETEAQIIGAGLLSKPQTAAPAALRRAFFLPGLVRAKAED